MMAWQSAQRPFVPPPAGAPNPVLAAILGLIPGVGAMYNGQFLKGLTHVLIFAVLVSASHMFGVFGLLIAGWVFYQVFDAYHTAVARRDGAPLPDPLGLNDVGTWLGIGQRGPGGPGAPGWTQPSAPTTGTGQASQGPAQAAQTSPYQAPYQGFVDPGTQQPSQWQTPYQGQGGAAGAGGTTPAGAGQEVGQGVAPMPPGTPPPMHWRRPEPIAAVVLIAFGVLFLLNKIDWFSGRVFEFSWPLVLIGLGVWLIVRRVGSVQGGQR